MTDGQLRQRIHDVAARLDGTMGVYIRVVASGEEVAINADQPFQMASVFKIPILMELICEVYAGKRSLEDRVTLAEEMKAPGSGVLKEISAGTRLTIRDLATLMIIVSDNTATDILLGLVTKAAVNARLQACGLRRTTVAMNCRELLSDLVGMRDAPDTPETRREVLDRLRRRALDPNSGVYRDEKANMTTPREMGALLGHVIGPTLDGGAHRGPLPVEVSRQMLEILRKHQVRDRLPLFLHPGVEIAHKTGSVTRVSNDAGVLYAPKSPCIVAVFTRDLSDDLQGRMAIGEVGRALYQACA